MTRKQDTEKHLHEFVGATQEEADEGLRDAVRQKDTGLAGIFLQHGADPGASGSQALKIAVRECDEEMIRLLFKHGADIHENGDEPLREAAGAGNLDIVKLLIEEGADIHAQEDAALVAASEKGQVEVVKLLIAEGANIHADDDVALSKAAFNGQAETAQALITEGADVFARNDNARKLALFDDHIEIAAMIEERQKAERAAFLEKLSGGLTMTDLRAEYGDTGECGLHRAVKADLFSEVMELSAKGGDKITLDDFDAKDRHGRTLLGVLAQWEKLGQVFRSEYWHGREQDVKALWQRVPEAAQKQVDFQEVVSGLNRNTLRESLRKRPKLGDKKP